MRHAVRAIVLRDNELLVMKRDKFGARYYTLPGGGVKWGEPARHALLREMREETGLKLGAGRLVFVENSGPVYGTQYVYLVDYLGGEPRLDPGSDEAKVDALGKNRYHPEWLPVEKLAGVTFVSPRLQQALLTALRTSFPVRAVTIH